jgi:hypothetical protein
VSGLLATSSEGATEAAGYGPTSERLPLDDLLRAARLGGVLRAASCSNQAAEPEEPAIRGLPTIVIEGVEELVEALLAS